LANPQGIEPRSAVLETDVMPLYQGLILLFNVWRSQPDSNRRTDRERVVS